MTLAEARTRPTLTVEEAAGLLGISRGLAFREAAKGSLAGVAVLRVGRRLVVPSAPLLARLGADE